MQALTSTYTGSLPGPFVLLLSLPAIPLLLFSIGARPLSAGSLPFSTDDLWQTTAFMSVAGAFMLSVALYPDLLNDTQSWIKGQGSTNAEGSKVTTAVSRARPAMQQAQAQGHQRQHQAQAHAQAQTNAPVQAQQQAYLRAEYLRQNPPPDQVIRQPPQLGRDKHGNRYWKPGRTITRRPVLNAVQPVVAPVSAPVKPLDSRAYTSLTAKHLAYLREGVLAPYYSPAKPNALLALAIATLTLGLLIVIIGKALGNAYDLDKPTSRTSGSSGSSRSKEGGEAWPATELSKRQGETESETKKRMSAQEKEFMGRIAKYDDKRRAEETAKKKKDIEKLKGELKKRKMPAVGLDWDYGGGSKRAKSSDPKTGKDKGEDGKDAKAKSGEEKPGIGSKLKQTLLGPLASGPPKDKSISPPANPKDSGPGWKVADDAVAHAAIRGGAARAENMANELVKQKKA